MIRRQKHKASIQLWDMPTEEISKVLKEHFFQTFLNILRLKDVESRIFLNQNTNAA